MSDAECVKVRAGEVVFADDTPKPPPSPLLPSWPFAAMRDLGAKLATANRHLANVQALIAHARKISPSDRMCVYVGDLEHALGMRDEPARSKNDEGTTS